MFETIPAPAPTARADPAPPVRPFPAAAAAILTVDAFCSKPVPAIAVRKSVTDSFFVNESSASIKRIESAAYVAVPAVIRFGPI